MATAPTAMSAELPTRSRPRLRLGKGILMVAVQDGEEQLFSEHFACVYCGISLPEFAPRNFSFNSPHGACPACTGLGTTLEIDPELVIPNRNLIDRRRRDRALVERSGTTSSYFLAGPDARSPSHTVFRRPPIRELAAGAPEDRALRLKDRKGPLALRVARRPQPASTTRRTRAW